MHRRRVACAAALLILLPLLIKAQNQPVEISFTVAMSRPHTHLFDVEVAVKRTNNTSDTSLFVGRGANMPYDMYEAEDGTPGGGASLLGPNRTIGDLAGEASGRRAVTLGATGSYVQWTTRAPTNTLVTRFSIPDSAGGGGTTSALSIYVNGTLHKTISLNSRYAWLYGAEAGPSNSPGAGGPRHIYDEANVMLNSTVPAGATIKLQKDAANATEATVDFVNT